MGDGEGLHEGRGVGEEEHHSTHGNPLRSQVGECCIPVRTCSQHRQPALTPCLQRALGGLPCDPSLFTGRLPLPLPLRRLAA